MEKIPKQVYTKGFREQAAKLVLQDGMSVPEAARRLSMSAKTLANWVHFARSGKLVEMGEKRKPVTDLEAENSRLRRELAEAKMERDLLKTRQQAIGEITEHIKIFYNRQRRHSRLGYVAPAVLQNSFISSTKQRETHGVHY